MNLAVEIAGWAGAVLILLAYFLVSTGRVEAASRSYQWINVGGAAGILVNSAWHGAVPSVGLNLVWLAIAFAALWRIAGRRRADS